MSRSEGSLRGPRQQQRLQLRVGLQRRARGARPRPVLDVRRRPSPPTAPRPRCRRGGSPIPRAPCGSVPSPAPHPMRDRLCPPLPRGAKSPLFSLPCHDPPAHSDVWGDSVPQEPPPFLFHPQESSHFLVYSLRHVGPPTSHISPDPGPTVRPGPAPPRCLSCALSPPAPCQVFVFPRNYLLLAPHLPLPISCTYLWPAPAHPKRAPLPPAV